MVTFIISTHNRREVLLHTLGELQFESERSGVACETIVVDNASSDGTARAVMERFPAVRLIPLFTNQGACAKNVALAAIENPLVVFLDDDSYPASGSIRRMIQHFEANPRLGRRC